MQSSALYMSTYRQAIVHNGNMPHLCNLPVMGEYPGLEQNQTGCQNSCRQFLKEKHFIYYFINLFNFYPNFHSWIRKPKAGFGFRAFGAIRLHNFTNTNHLATEIHMHASDEEGSGHKSLDQVSLLVIKGVTTQKKHVLEQINHLYR